MFRMGLLIYSANIAAILARSVNRQSLKNGK